MAKARRRVKQRTPFSRESQAEVHPSEPALWRDRLRNAALLIFGGMMVYVAFHPSDSVAVERGDALWFCAVAILFWTCTFAGESFHAIATGTRLRLDALDWLAGGLASWMMIVAFFVPPEISLRDATNEAWFWVAAMAVFSASRRLFLQPRCRRMTLGVLVAVGAMLAILALHQHWVSLPETRAAFLADPESVMRAAGIDAPPVSSQRMVFASRLFDGGPTATFALANSLAAVLVFTMLGSIVSLLPLLRSSWKWIAGLGVIVSGLAVLATNSRSAIVIAFVAGPLLLSLRWSQLKEVDDDSNGPRAGRIKGGVGVVTWIGVAVTILAAFGVAALLAIAFLGDDELIREAPDSLTFRFRYWKSSLLLLIDHPWFGAGPGGFRALYLGYRLPVANEVIADPHNFVVETLTSGGLPAGLLLGFMAFYVARSAVGVVRKPRKPEADANDADANDAAEWIVIGAAVSLVSIWVFGAIANQLPETRALLVAIPFSAFVGASVFYQLGNDEASGVRGSLLLATVSIVAILVHLSVSGGWTVPGVAIFVWILAAMLSSDRSDEQLAPVGDGQRGRRLSTFLVLAVGGTLVLFLQYSAIAPVRAASQSLGRAEDALRRGLDARVEQESLSAVEADRWDEDAAVWRSEYLKNRLLQRESLRSRDEWRSAVDEARRRGNDNPLVLAPLIYQAIHIHQRYGRVPDLEFAVELSRSALEQNPHDLKIRSILANCLEALGDRDSGLRMARETKRLSELDDNLVRHLNVVHTPEIMASSVDALQGRVTGNLAVRSVEKQFRDRFPELYEPGIGSPRTANP